MKHITTFPIQFFCTVLFLTALPAGAALTTVGDLGGESAAPYLDAVNGQLNEFSPPQSLSNAVPLASLSISNMLPVSTPEMTPGKVMSRSLNLPGMPAVFIVGSDSMSREWLQQRGAQLRSLGATGMVVNIASERELEDVQKLAPDVVMAPVQAGDLARRLQLAHYPVLITADGLVQ